MHFIICLFDNEVNQKKWKNFYSFLILLFSVERRSNVIKPLLDYHLFMHVNRLKKKKKLNFHNC